MKIEDSGIILSSNRFGDSSMIVKILSENHGPVKGLIKGRGKNGANIQVGNYVHFIWSARLSEQLGMLTISLEKAYPLLSFSEYQKILSISSISALIDVLIPDREDSTHIFTEYKNYLEEITFDNWLNRYVMLEMFILEKSGFGFDLGQCAVSGSTENITYISPKTGSAVSRDIGEPYKERLFPIPAFFLPPTSENPQNQPYPLQEIVDGLEITRYFLAKHFFAESLAKIPSPCIQFRDEILRVANLNEQARQNRDHKLS